MLGFDSFRSGPLSDVFCHEIIPRITLDAHVLAAIRVCKAWRDAFLQHVESIQMVRAHDHATVPIFLQFRRLRRVHLGCAFAPFAVGRQVTRVLSPNTRAPPALSFLAFAQYILPRLKRLPRLSELRIDWPQLSHKVGQYDLSVDLPLNFELQDAATLSTFCSSNRPFRWPMFIFSSGFLSRLSFFAYRPTTPRPSHIRPRTEPARGRDGSRALQRAARVIGRLATSRAAAPSLH